MPFDQKIDQFLSSLERIALRLALTVLLVVALGSFVGSHIKPERLMAASPPCQCQKANSAKPGCQCHRVAARQKVVPKKEGP